MTKAEARESFEEKQRQIQALLDEARKIAADNAIDVELTLDRRRAAGHYVDEGDASSTGEWHSAWDSSWC